MDIDNTNILAYHCMRVYTKVQKPDPRRVVLVTLQGQDFHENGQLKSHGSFVSVDVPGR